MTSANILKSAFFRRPDTVQIARDLIGKKLSKNFDGILTSGIIVETEAYCGSGDRACHAYGYKKTKRTAPMFGPGGLAYVYLIYGMYPMFNLVTNVEGEPHAILIRAIEPKEGIEFMLERRNMHKAEKRLTAGPGSLAKALGFTVEHTGISAMKDPVWVEETALQVKEEMILASSRVNIDYAKEDASLPYRFRLKENLWTSWPK